MHLQKYFELQTYLSIMRTICLAGAEPSLHQKRILEYVFDIFTKYSGKNMSKEELQAAFTLFADVPIE